jgi:acetyl/propionyl-CoA carboxylase alpha subunit
MKKKHTFIQAGRSYELSVDDRSGVAHIAATCDSTPLGEFTGAVTVDSPWLIVRSGDLIDRCAVARDNNGVWVSLRGCTFYFEHVRAHSAHAAASEIDQDEIRAPMTGTMLAVKVKPGDTVSKGDLLAVMEAMKMEYRLEAPLAGCVQKVQCKPGDMLDVGTLLIKLEPAPVG